MQSGPFTNDGAEADIVSPHQPYYSGTQNHAYQHRGPTGSDVLPEGLIWECEWSHEAMSETGSFSAEPSTPCAARVFQPSCMSWPCLMRWNSRNTSEERDPLNSDEDFSGGSYQLQWY